MPSEKVPGKPTSKDSGNSKHHQNSSSDSSTREWIEVTPDSAIGGPIVEFVKRKTKLEPMEVILKSADTPVDPNHHHSTGLSNAYAATSGVSVGGMTPEIYAQYNKVHFCNPAANPVVAVVKGNSVVDFNDAFWRCENPLREYAKNLGEEERNIMGELFDGLRKKYGKE